MMTTIRELLLLWLPVSITMSTHVGNCQRLVQLDEFFPFHHRARRRFFHFTKLLNLEHDTLSRDSNDYSWIILAEFEVNH